ncbi:4-hydroxy-tetrahydrodipicolinate reductase [candidate division WOR-1 bacterium RIFOXYB2_FULL_42_35]|uniref:4-hydroxy-tetrahydrodipicolinate reductase n=1 Tax=candidate division WOR-1 bacterium RIFOXYC2_FULL_41_25 TaxID=1802586 RepID=A0A1F4TLH7_UNCSA|nr:MAG: 4-hydroxy-tetrahydrodipicolinate reductase [candidate division WOR-1 bacterium RIFOXYA2_FULL_41_14]OGC23604.1 MAG: 4-hydroxy-tetrahydrodipicolinate reductase [candidate division WOR-1 bacterium RIFOXYB2_FULL_42_35]OGC33568.1 MAG: 4-hydroxy-tetrahydrodipicolinate reductase [candidate division WOR-1 bacterium RIFOXYC2_FULL_41_25]OGC41885.1 MAG: 4-hydroxy-tetrahydrodipicolinate reductase [candidate division WOR-1 bacterium RIFOXYD2_FULL_41_8]
MTKTRVLVNGAKGKMGSETVNAINNTADLELVAQIDLDDDLAASIKECQAEVVVDFTHPDSAFKNVKTILDCKAHAIVGTTGLTPANLAEIKKLCTKNKVNCIVAPNFAIGAILMMKFAREAAHYMPEVEIIELHHNQKADSPSGTAIKTAELILADRQNIKPKAPKTVEKLKHARGAELGGIHIHSIRLQGFVAHQEVIFGGLGQSLKIRHDSISRESFMPGVVMAIRKVKKLKGLVYGLENLL